jgi:hypothetical protein
MKFALLRQHDYGGQEDYVINDYFPAEAAVQPPLLVIR